MKQTVELVKNKDGTWGMTLPEEPKVAALEKSAAAWMDTEVMGVPVAAGLVGGGVAELASALVAKIPQLSTIFGGNAMMTDLVLALGLGYMGEKKKWEWAKYGSMFMVFAAFQTQIQSLISSISGAVGTTKWAQDGMEQSDTDTPAAVQQWLMSQ